MGSFLDTQIFEINRSLNAHIIELNVSTTLSGVDLDFLNHIHAWTLSIGTYMP